jgi:hypothetical protein
MKNLKEKITTSLKQNSREIAAVFSSDIIDY